MADMNLKVSPEQMTALAEETQQIHRTISSAVDEITKIRDSLKAAWLGDSSELFAKTWAELSDSAKPMIESVHSQMQTLNELAGIYTTAETAAQKQNEGLPTEGVFL